MVRTLVVGLQAIAKAYPQTSPIVAQINPLLSKMGLLVMEHQAPGEPAAPPA